MLAFINNNMFYVCFFGEQQQEEKKGKRRWRGHVYSYILKRKYENESFFDKPTKAGNKTYFGDLKQAYQVSKSKIKTHRR